MIIIKSRDEIVKMREGGKILAAVLHAVVDRARAGVPSLELDALAYDLLVANGGKPAFKGYQGYPASLCVSINNEVVHGIPSKSRILREGDVVGFDLGYFYKGFYTDMAESVGIGSISPKARKLLSVTHESLQRGLRTIKPGKKLGDIGFAIQSHVEKHGFSVVRSLVGHGVGKQVHEEPQVPNFGHKNTGITIEEGMTLAVEPMVTAGEFAVKILNDQWTVVTKDSSLSAHFERTIAVTQGGFEIITPW